MLNIQHQRNYPLIQWTGLTSHSTHSSSSSSLLAEMDTI